MEWKIVNFNTSILVGPPIMIVGWSEEYGGMYDFQFSVPNHMHRIVDRIVETGIQL